MAVKIFQGLIDVGGSGGSGSTTKVNSEKEGRGGNAQSAPVVVTQRATTTSAPPIQSKEFSDAAVTALRSRFLTNDGRPLRDSRDVDALAFSVSERIASSTDKNGATHGRLSSEKARPHFQ